MRARLADPSVAYQGRWYTLLVLCLSLTIIGLDNTILNVALPTLAKPAASGGLGASGSQLQWIVDSYTIVFAGLLLTAGSLGDRFGRYRALTAGIVIFGVGSMISALAGSASMLIGSRALMGVGGAFIMPATLSILTNLFRDPRERAVAIGVWAGVSALGIGIGPVAGGALLEHFWWGAVFLVNIPVVLVALVGGFTLVPDSRDPSAPSLDPVGSGLSIVGLGTLLWAIIEGPAKGWTSTPVVTAFVVGAVVAVVFVMWERSYKSPMLDMSFFSNPRFSAASAAITLTFFAMFGMLFLLTQYLQTVLGLSTVRAGAVWIPLSITVMILAPLSTRLVRRFGNKAVVATGMAVASLSMFSMQFLTTDSSETNVILVSILLAVGMANIMAPATEAIMGSLPHEKAGVGSAMNDTTRQVGGALGVALFGSILSSRFSSEMTSSLKGFPPALVDQAKNSIGTAFGIANQDPRAKPFAPKLIDAAQHAFVDGMHTATTVGGFVLLLGAVAVAKWLPSRASEPGFDHATAIDAVPLGLSSVDVFPAGMAADLADELSAKHALEDDVRT